MLSYLNRLENLIERWQSRKRTIEISKTSSPLHTKLVTKSHTDLVPKKLPSPSIDKVFNMSSQREQTEEEETRKEICEEQQAVTKNITKKNLKNKQEENILINMTANRMMTTKHQQDPLQQAVVGVNPNRLERSKSLLKEDNSSLDCIIRNKEENIHNVGDKNFIVRRSEIIQTITSKDKDKKNNNDNDISRQKKNDCLRQRKTTTTTNNCNNDNTNTNAIKENNQRTLTGARRKEERKIINFQQHNYFSSSILTICPSLIYVISLFFILSAYIDHNSVAQGLTLFGETGGSNTTIKSSSLLNNSNNINIISQLKQSERAKKALDMFVKQLSNRERWTNLPDYTMNENNNHLNRWVRRRTPAGQQQPLHQSPDGGIFSSSSVSRRPNFFAGAEGNNRGGIRQLMNRIRTRIGARNSIRVHNAFRDLAWRLLSSFSMPTPVIYELRRQHFYSPEDDEMNDKLYNKNTTKTIRSRRQMPTNPRAADDDEDEDESLRGRIRLRLEDLANLSRRSLFGRVIRLPSIFPFKRQQQDLNDSTSSSGGNNNLDSKSKQKGEVVAKSGQQQGRKQSRLSSLRARQRRKRKEADRQMIIINGKQYYVSDSGELKEWTEESKND